MKYEQGYSELRPCIGPNICSGTSGETLIRESRSMLPVVLGKDGVDSIPDLPPLSEYEQKLLDEMRPTLEANIQKGIEFANAE